MSGEPLEGDRAFLLQALPHSSGRHNAGFVITDKRETGVFLLPVRCLSPYHRQDSAVTPKSFWSLPISRCSTSPRFTSAYI